MSYILVQYNLLSSVTSLVSFPFSAMFAMHQFSMMA